MYFFWVVVIVCNGCLLLIFCVRLRLFIVMGGFGVVDFVIVCDLEEERLFKVNEICGYCVVICMMLYFYLRV